MTFCLTVINFIKIQMGCLHFKFMFATHLRHRHILRHVSYMWKVPPTLFCPIRCEILQYRHLQNQGIAILSEILHMIHISKHVIHNLKHLIKNFLQ